MIYVIKIRMVNYMYHIITTMLKYVHRKHTGEIYFKLLAAVLSQVYEIIDNI